MQELFPYFKMVHVVAAVLFVGNMVVTGVWKTLADRTEAGSTVAFAQRLVTLTDYLFTLPGALVILLSGFAMLGGPDSSYWSQGWVHWGILLFVISGLLWLVALIPIQVKQARLARSFIDGGDIPESYWTLCRRWRILGSLATLLAFAAVVIMVVKP